MNFNKYQKLKEIVWKGCGGMKPKIIKPIYRPKGKAADYAEYALNIYSGCNHKCEYCYSPLVLRKTKEEFEVRIREGIYYSTLYQLERSQIKGKMVHLCFTCDPYPGPSINTSITRNIIWLLKRKGNNVQILTKAGSRAERDFDILDINDLYGCTLTWNDSLESGADTTQRRIESLKLAKEKYGLRTWVSIEPVFYPQKVYELIENGNYIDHFMIGKLNYMPSDTDWKEFGQKCASLCEKHGRNFKIKTDLRKILNKEGL